MAGILLNFFVLAATASDASRPDAISDSGEAVAQAAHSSLVPSHSFAVWIMKMIRQGLDAVGFHHNDLIEELIYAAIVLVMAIFIGVIIRKSALYTARKIVALRHSHAAELLLSQRVLHTCSNIIPPLVFLALIPFAFSSNLRILDWILRLAGVYTLITFAIAMNSILVYCWTRFDERENTQNHPLKGVLNVCQGILWIIIIIISISVLINRSPMTLLAGLGAFAAALMLIFKDSILGFVAGIQLSQNDMLRVGDWINVPSTIANGIVMDVTLTVVKVQNFDNTLVMLPPYTLVSTSFQNWRNMFAVGARMIDHNIFIDHSSIRPATPELLAETSRKYPLLADFIEKQQKAKEMAGSKAVFTQEYNNSHGVNGTIDTNLGLFRAYACCYLMNHPRINSQTQDMLISMDPPESYGVALNINCYSNMTGWAQFEAVKAEIIEHLHAAAPDFGLTVYNTPDRNRFEISTDSNATDISAGNGRNGAPVSGAPAARAS